MKQTFLFIFASIFMSIEYVHSQNNPGTYTYKFGEAAISLLQESQQDGKPDILIGATPEILAECAPGGVYPSAVNIFLVHINGKNILIDSGFGSWLFDNLQSLGIEPEAIDIVLLTHLHGDHTGGMMRNGQPSFPKAQVYLSEVEYNYWLNETKDERAHAMLSAYKEQIRLFTPGEPGENSENILPGIQAIKAYGHTPGHTAYLFTSAGKPFLVWGDVINAAAVQIPYPGVSAIYDKDASQAVETRKKILRFAAKNNIPAAGMHIPATGMITLSEKSGQEGFTLEGVD